MIVFWLKYMYNRDFLLRIRQEVIFVSGNGAEPNRERAIIWTNDEPVDWFIY